MSAKYTWIKDRIALATVKVIFPQALRAWQVDKCDSCKREGLIFWIDKVQEVDNDGFVQGGFYCQKCGFSNAGKCSIELLLR